MIKSNGFYSYIIWRGIATRVKSSKDVFGTLSESGSKKLAINSLERYLPDDPDGYDRVEIDLTPRKNAYFYKYEITKYARQGSIGLRRALELFQAMKSDRIEPTCENFSPLIYGCARAGYTKKAFELYEESEKYLTRPTASVVTCLINSCAESPFKEYGLKRLEWFLKHIKINLNITMNRVQYNTAIKAYGKLGQLNEAAKLVQEMTDNNISPYIDTFNMLLIGCASQPESGCSLALRVYKRIRYYNVKPNLATYRLLLRCIRDCETGPPELIQRTLAELPAITTFDQKLRYKKMKKNLRGSKKDLNDNFEWFPTLSDLSSSISTAVETVPTKNTSENRLIKKPNSSELTLAGDLLDSSSANILRLPILDRSLPNLLSDDHLMLHQKIESINLDKLHDSRNRLQLFGGMHGFLEKMVQDGCKPDNKTFSLILPCIRFDEILDYYRTAKYYSIERDILFYNLLIRGSCKNLSNPKRLEEALYFLDELQKDGLKPNITTFESIALGCDKLNDAQQLISDVENCGFTVSGVMISRLFKCALYKNDFMYINTLIKYCREKKIPPVKHLVESLEEKRLYAHDIILKYEKNQLKNDELPEWLNDKQIKSFDIFNTVLGRWLRSVDLQEEEHPWNQFKVKEGSHKLGFYKYVNKFKALERAKKEALESGANFGNLNERAEEIFKKETRWK